MLPGNIPLSSWKLRDTKLHNNSHETERERENRIQTSCLDNNVWKVGISWKLVRLYWRNLLQFEIPATSTPPNILLFTDLITKKRRKIAYHFKLEGRKFDFTRRSNFISGTNGFPVNGEPIFQVNRIGIISTVYPLSFVKCENLLIKRCRRPKVNSRSWNFHLDENIRSANIEVLGIRTRESSSSEYKIFNIFLFIATSVIESNFTGEILFSQKKKNSVLLYFSSPSFYFPFEETN